MTRIMIAWRRAFPKNSFNRTTHSSAWEQSFSSGNQVNRVRVTNDGGKPLYLMPGEIILGGDQDRCIAKEYVIKSDGKPVAVEVFCVEHGRWGNRSQQYNRESLAAVQMNIEFDAPSASISEQAAKADNDEFIASANVGNKSVRIAVQQNAKQSIVWDAVAKLNRKSGATSGSGTYTANFTVKEANKKLQPFRIAFRDPVAKVPNIVGVVVEINGRAESADVFATTPLFKKLWPRLLEGYAVDAATAEQVTKPDDGQQIAPSDKPESADAGPAHEFLASILTDRGAAGGAHGKSKSVIALPSEQSYTDAFSSSIPVHIAGYSSDGEMALSAESQTRE